MLRRLFVALKTSAIILFLAHILLLFITQHTPQSLQKETQLGRSYRFKIDEEYFGEITDYAICDNILYVLYEAKAVLKCYDLSGVYICSYCFYAHQNGYIELKFTGEDLYLKDRNNNYYLLNSDRVVRFLCKEQNKDEIMTLEKSFVSDSQKRTDMQGNTYKLKGASIWKTDPYGNQTQVIHRPWILQFISLKYFAISHFICMILLAISLLYEKFGRN